MPEMATWEVTLFVTGPITVIQPIRLIEAKGDRYTNPFYSDIRIKRKASGVVATVTAHASTNTLAHKAALLFFGQMLDALTLLINQPMHLSFYDRRSNDDETFTTKRRVERNEWSRSFQEARILGFSEQAILRALGWYRKGLYTEDPFDKFLAFWNSIEIVAGKYHPPIPEGRPTGSKSQIWECFKAIWGECEGWPTISGDTDWIDDNYEIRLQIAHGTVPVVVHEVEIIINKLDTLEKVAYQFLSNWRNTQLILNCRLTLNWN